MGIGSDWVLVGHRKFDTDSGQIGYQIPTQTLVKIQNWMNCNGLQMNAAKTEFIVFRTKFRLNNLQCNLTKISNIDISVSTVLKYFDVLSDSHFNMKKFIAGKGQLVLLNLLKIKRIRQYLILDTAKMIVDALVTSHLDYANGVSIGLLNIGIQKLQRIQNKSAKVILKKNKLHSSTACLCELHWLPIATKKEFKINTMVSIKLLRPKLADSCMY